MDILSTITCAWYKMWLRERELLPHGWWEGFKTVKNKNLYPSSLNLHGYTVKDITCLVQDVVERKWITTTGSHGWWEGFKTRHPEIVKRKPESVTHVHSLCAQPTVLEKYSEVLECTLRDNDWIERPPQIFNLDETGMPLDPKASTLLLHHGDKGILHNI